MTEDDARAWLRSRVSSAVFAVLEALVHHTREGATAQNLVGPATLATIWNRHIVDSVQLLELAGEPAATWADIGTGAGFPGLVLAACGARQVACVEPRRLRADWLLHLAKQLGLDNVTVLQCRAEHAAITVDAITARAVAPVVEILAMTRHLAHPGTVWALPAGRSASHQLDDARRRWHGVFHVERSITDPDAGIVVARHVEKKRP